MKRNLLSILILALLLVNTILTGVMMFSLATTNAKTAKLISDIGAAMKLEQAGGTGGGTASAPEEEVALNDQVSYEIAGPDSELTIPLTPGADGKQHYLVLQCAVSINKKHDDFKTYGSGDLSAYKDKVIDTINQTIGSYTFEELQQPKAQDDVKKKVLGALRSLFDGSTFIYQISFSKFLAA